MGEKKGGACLNQTAKTFLFLGMFLKIQINFSGKQAAARNTRDRVFYRRHFIFLPILQNINLKSAFVLRLLFSNLYNVFKKLLIFKELFAT